MQDGGRRLYEIYSGAIYRESALYLRLSLPALCVQTRMDAPDIKCARDGSFTPVQCRPVNDSDSAEGSRVTRRRTPELCRCVDPENGSTVEGTETLVQGTADMPKCQEKSVSSDDNFILSIHCVTF